MKARDNSSGQWHELKQAVFGGDTKANYKVELDIDADADNVEGCQWVFMISGGYFDGKTSLNKFLTRKPTNIKPLLILMICHDLQGEFQVGEFLIFLPCS